MRKRKPNIPPCRGSNIVHKYLAKYFAKQLETINSFSQVAGYKINSGKSIVFLYTTNHSKRRDTLPFIIASKAIKYPKITLI